MRVIAGEARGCKLKSLGGALRPTTDLVRGAIFSILGSLGSSSSRVLDLYAGTGALGIEALSRGGEWTDFVEQDERRCALIRENLERTKLAQRAKVYCVGAEKALSFLDSKYDVIFLDPPYSNHFAPKLLEKLASSNLVSANTTIVAQHHRHLNLPSALGNFGLVRSRRYGDTCISFYRKEVGC